MKSSTIYHKKRGRNKLTSINPADKNGIGRNNVKIRGHGKKRLNPERSTTGTPPPARPGALLDRKVSAGQSGRWASRGGIRTGARASPTKGDNL